MYDKIKLSKPVNGLGQLCTYLYVLQVVDITSKKESAFTDWMPNFKVILSSALKVLHLSLLKQ